MGVPGVRAVRGVSGGEGESKCEPVMMGPGQQKKAQNIQSRECVAARTGSKGTGLPASLSYKRLQELLYRCLPTCV